MTHDLRVIALGTHPAACCSCQNWGYAFAGAENASDTTKRKALLKAHAEHVKAHKRGRK